MGEEGLESPRLAFRQQKRGSSFEEPLEKILLNRWVLESRRRPLFDLRGVHHEYRNSFGGPSSPWRREGFRKKPCHVVILNDMEEQGEGPTTPGELKSGHVHRLDFHRRLRIDTRRDSQGQVGQSVDDADRRRRCGHCGGGSLGGRAKEGRRTTREQSAAQEQRDDANYD